MAHKKIIEGKCILIVDDEKDVLESLVELLSMCKIDTASSFVEAKEMLKENYYDLAILDIMGVDGYELLKIANSYKVPCIMLTAHALTSDNLKRSAEEGAAYYAPKDEITNIAKFVGDVIEAIHNGMSTWKRMFDRLGAFYDRKFKGTDWREKEKEFWQEKLEKGLF